MKLALPIALVTIGVVIVALLMTPRAWERTAAAWRADHDKVEQARQNWFTQHPDAKAEDLDLNSKYQEASKAMRDCRQSYQEAHAGVVNHDRKIRDELIKNDPTLEPVFDRVEFDKRVPIDGGDQELFVEYGQYPGWYSSAFLSASYVLPAITLLVGILLLFRLPSWSGAHLFLMSVFLPLVLLGPLMFRFAMGVYLIRFAEFDMAPTPYMFQQVHHLLVLDYLSFLPSLLIYVTVLIRLWLRDRKANRIQA